MGRATGLFTAGHADRMRLMVVLVGMGAIAMILS
jgi:hypothetical protein